MADHPGKKDLSRSDVFTDEWLAEAGARWAIGLFVADGSLLAPQRTSRGCLSSPRVTLEMDWADTDGVKHFAAALGLPADRVRQRRRVGYSDRAVVSFQSPRVIGLHELGFPYGKKSDSVTAPEILAQDVHFWRGVVDGDGYTSKSGNTVHLALRSNSVGLLGQFEAFMANCGLTAHQCGIDQTGSSRCVLTGDQAVAGIRLLYADEPAVSRKRDKAIALAEAWEGRPRGTSLYRGVSWDRRRNKWTARIGPRGAAKLLGCFDTETEAADAVRRHEACREMSFGNAVSPQVGEWIGRRLRSILDTAEGAW